jgi:hypothetical protein
MKRYVLSVFLAIPLIICTLGTSFPQGMSMQAPLGKPDGPGPGGPPPDNQKTRMWLFDNMVKYLKLDDAAANRFRPIFMEYSENRGKFMREHFEIFHKISDAVDTDSTPITELQTLAQRYKSLERSLWKEREKFFQRSEAILDARQMVKLTIYEDKMKDELFRRMRKDHQNTPGEQNATPQGPFK